MKGISCSQKTKTYLNFMGNLAHQIMLAIINFNTSCMSVPVYSTVTPTLY